MPRPRAASSGLVQKFILGFFMGLSFMKCANNLSAMKLETFVEPSYSNSTVAMPNLSETAFDGDKQQEDGYLAFIAYSHLRDTSRFEKYVFPSLDTWMSKEEENITQKIDYYLVLINGWKDKYFSELCPKYQHYCDRMKPIFLDCEEGEIQNGKQMERVASSFCCKQEKALALLEQTTNYRFYAFHDDDTYFRTKFVMNFLSAVDQNTDLFVMTGGMFTTKALGQTSYRRKRFRPYSCTKKNRDFTYNWGQPVFYPRQTLQHIAPGLRAGGLSKQCAEFDVAQDVGNAIFHWMYSLPELRMRFSTRFPRRDNGVHGTHGVDHKVGTENMTQLQARFRAEEDSFAKHRMRWHNVTGFHNTSTYLHHGEPSTWGGNTWHTMPVRDCLAGGP